MHGGFEARFSATSRGVCYERIGSHVLPLHRLVAGPNGEVIDLTPPLLQSRPRPVTRQAAPMPVEDDDVVDVLDQPPASEQVATWHELLSPVLGTRVVRFGEFKNMLGPQLLHPERLRDTHRICCRVHVYEATCTQRIESLASSLFNGGSGVLLRLTDALASRLELAGLMHRRGATTPANREPGTVFPGERVVRLAVIDDPTAGIHAPATATPPTTDSGAATGAAASAPAAPPPGRTMKTAIPERFVGPWQFTVSRDEAVYDLNQDRARPRIRALIDRLRGNTASSREFRKWQVLLGGKSHDDQLWAVRPPRGGFADRAVRDWARRTLETAGYDPDTMLLEWEIFWRRKGL